MIRQFSGQFYTEDKTVVVVHWDDKKYWHWGHKLDSLGDLYTWDMDGKTIPVEMNLVKKVNPQQQYRVPVSESCPSCKEYR